MGFKIKEVRKSLKMSQEELAEKSGISRGTIVALEAGTERVTTTKTLVALAAAMNVSIDQIFFCRRCLIGYTGGSHGHHNSYQRGRYPPGSR